MLSFLLKKIHAKMFVQNVFNNVVIFSASVLFISLTVVVLRCPLSNLAAYNLVHKVEVSQESLRFQELLPTFLQVIDHCWLLVLLKTCNILTDLIQVPRFNGFRFWVPFQIYFILASSNSQHILLYVISDLRFFERLNFGFYSLLKNLQIFCVPCIFICVSTLHQILRTLTLFDNF